MMTAAKTDSGRVVLFNPRSNAQCKPVLPMSLLALDAVLDGVDTVIVDGNLLATDEAAIENLRRELDGDGPRVLCVTVMPGPQLEQAVPIAKAIRATHPRAHIVWGGYFPSQHWEVSLESGIVDYVVRSHADQVFPAFIEALLDNDTDAVHALPNVAYRREDGSVHSNATAPLPQPEQLPRWNLERVEVERYLRETFLGQRTLGYNSSYGCPFFCNFCAVVNLVQGGWLAQSAERVAEAAREYRDRHRVDAIEFVDNNFFVQEKRVRRFAELTEDLGIAWWGEGRIDTMLGFGEDTWRAMRDSGLRMVFLGAESGSDETLAQMDKGGRMSTDKTREMVATMARWDIVPELSFVLGNPPDPERDAKQTMAFIREIKSINPRTEIILYQYTPVPLAGDLFHQAKASGFDFPTTLEGWISDEWIEFSQRRSQDNMPWVGQSLARRLRDFERVINAYYPTSTFEHLNGWRRGLLRLTASWRYHARAYRFPFELAALHKLLRYQRPETSGF